MDFLTDPRLARLTPADIGGLMLLWSSAWILDNRIPSDDASLASMSRLGEAWPSSGLRSSLALFFVLAGGEGEDSLRSIDLAGQLDRDIETREKRRKAGIASAEARKVWGEGVVQHVFNTC